MKYAHYSMLATVTVALLLRFQPVASAPVVQATSFTATNTAATKHPWPQFIKPITFAKPAPALVLADAVPIALLPVPTPVATPAPAISPPALQPPAAQTAVAAPQSASSCGDNSYATYIYEHESSCRTDAVNSIGACGIGQALPCSTMGCSLTDYVCQNAYFTNYALTRYGSWANAAAFWVSHSWW